MPETIPYVFEDEEKEYSTSDWDSQLSKDPDTYNQCFVRALTHVKNLKSSVLHEYLQIIVERTDTKDPSRTRLLAERQNDGDRVIAGRSSWAPSSSSGGFLGNLLSSSSRSSSGGKIGDYPLPLYSLKFTSGEFPIVRLAEILRKTTEDGGRYSIRKKKHCFWFAKAVYNTVKYSFQCVEKTWRWAKYQYYAIIPVLPETMSQIKDIGSLVTRDLDVVHKAALPSSPESDCDDHSLAGLTTYFAVTKAKDFMKVSVDILQDDDRGRFTDVYRDFNLRKKVETLTTDDEEMPDTPDMIKAYSLSEDEVKSVEAALQVMVGRVLESISKT
ncbi:hypothetical protein Trco_004997 [Trichoderma cornu-damae]|uniref:Uncharacterized protein n=1 Tax=Trichoderma cornu-damae TaxID=654480 RepID=A0A9P8TW22_9HYPO|nr:hypothetical protein Trco_004997 [Trichoderma cornu-damae]